MTRKQFFGLLFFVLPMMYFFSLPIETGDLAIWVSEGRKILQSGNIHFKDSFSVLPTTELFYPVLTSVIYAHIDQYFSLVGVSFFHKIIFCLFLFQFYFIFIKENQSWSALKVGCFLISMWGLSFIMIDRPALLALPLFLYAFVLLEKVKIVRKDTFLLLIFLNIFWVNIHGSWIFLTVLTLIRAVGIYLENKKFVYSYFFLILFLLITSGINPYGFEIFNYAYKTAYVSKLRNIDEWGSSWTYSKYYSQSFALYILIFLQLAIELKMKKSKRNYFLSLSLMSFNILGFFTIRNSIWGFVIFPIFLLRKIDFEKPERIEERKNNFNVVIAIILIFYGLLLTPFFKKISHKIIPNSKSSVFSTKTPILISNYLLNSKLDGNIFNQWELGSYLTYAQPKKIFIDTRNIIYDDNEIEIYKKLALNKTDHLNEIFESYNVVFVVINKFELNQLYSRLLKDKKNWKLIMTENELVLFERKRA